MSALISPQGAPACDEQHLVEAVRRGEDEAFGEFYERYGERVASYIAGMVGDHARAEDIAQDVFISALRRMRATDGPIVFKPWIYEIARNACIDEFRRNRRSPEVPLQLDGDGEGDARRLVSRTPSPDAALESRQQLEDLRGAFGGLSESHHKVLVLRELEGLSYTQIGERLGMSRPVVESTLFRARRRLNSEYEEIASGRRCEQVRAVVDIGAEQSLRALGVRERRRLKRHLSHCQPCRRYAHAAGVDESSLGGGLVGKIAALLPIPGFLRLRRSRPSRAAASTHTSRAAQSLQAAVQWANPASPGFGLDRAAAAFAALAVAGGGVVGALNVAQSGNGSRNAQAVRSAAFSSSQSGRDQPLGVGIVAVAAGNRFVRRGPAVAHRTPAVGHATDSASVAPAGGRVASNLAHPSDQTPPAQQVAYAPPPPSPSTTTAATQPENSAPRHSRSRLPKLTSSGVSSALPAAQNPAVTSAPQTVSQIGSSALSQAGNVGSQVIDTVQTVVNQGTGGGI